MKIDAPSACQRHITVTIPHEDIERYFDKAFGELMPEAQVPGFRAGRAPRKLVEHRFRKEVTDQVKSELLMDSLAQISEEQKLAAISEPDFDLDAVEVPDDGPMTFEFDIEVRPEFDMPQWKGLTSSGRRASSPTTTSISSCSSCWPSAAGWCRSKARRSRATTSSANITFKDGENVLSKPKSKSLCIRPTLSFRDGKIENFDKLMKGVKAGETREAEAKLTDDAPNEALRGKTVTAVFEVLEVKKLELPELTAEFLEELGDFKSEDELRDAMREELAAAVGISPAAAGPAADHAALIASANWDLPPDLLQAAKPSRVGAGRPGTAPQRLQRRGDPRPRERSAAEQPVDDGPGLEGTFHPGADRRG